MSKMPPYSRGGVRTTTEESEEGVGLGQEELTSGTWRGSDEEEEEEKGGSSVPHDEGTGSRTGSSEDDETVLSSPW